MGIDGGLKGIDGDLDGVGPAELSKPSTDSGGRNDSALLRHRVRRFPASCRRTGLYFPFSRQHSLFGLVFSLTLGEASTIRLLCVATASLRIAV